MKHVHFLSIRPIAAKYPHCWQTRDVTCIALALRRHVKRSAEVAISRKQLLPTPASGTRRHLRKVSKTSNAVARRDDAQIDTHRGAANLIAPRAGVDHDGRT